jgi:periplasmic protein TonB
MKTQVESFDDIVFEHRNQEYGAYELRKKYPKRGTIALVISLIVLSIAVGVPLIASIMQQRNLKRYLEKSAAAEMANLKEVKRDEVAPPPPPPPPPAVKEIKFVAPKIVDSLTNEEVELASTDDLSDAANAGPVDTTTKVVEVIVEETAPVVEQVFESFAIQEKPAFPGGDAELIKYVAEHTKYPVIAQENGIEGTVYIRFVVTRTGDVGEAKVMRAVDPLLEEEALRVVKALPKWTPGKNNGNPVNVWFIIPVKFKLQ